MRETRYISPEEMQVQKAYSLAIARQIEGREMKYHIVTQGCQMNAHDSETVAGMLDEMGMKPVPSKEEADLILYNTCCVRENAENKAFGNVIWLKELKAKRPDLIICIGGCMVQEKGMAERIEKYPFIDLAYGTYNLYRLPELMHRVIVEKRRAIEVLEDDGALCEGLPTHRSNRFMNYINIMYGCNNFCSYCIVPYVRGRERSRNMQDILDEAKRLQDEGTQEIMLLGQNVNSYMGGGANFAELLYRLDRMGIPRIRFMTSHPKDLSGELIACFGELGHLCKHLHLPVQAGSDRILQQMNRHYTREKYLDLVTRIRKVCPEIGLTTDIIVGFPGETFDEFEETVSLVEQVRFDSAFTFIYSPRVGTVAAKLPDPTSAEEKSRRIQLLIDRQQAITSEICAQQIGKMETVLIESLSARDEGFVCGKTGRSHMVNFPGSTELIGQMKQVRITQIGKSTLRGVLVEQ